MNYRFYLFTGGLYLIASGFSSCMNGDEEFSGRSIIEKSIIASGGENYNPADINFEFRNVKYKSSRKGGIYRLERKHYDSLGNSINEVVTNEGVFRYINQNLTNIPDSVALSISNGINSVHYFVQIPYVLKDPASRIKLIGEDKIEGENYYEIKVTFSENSGGTDHEDEYLYWVNKKTFYIDFLAYKFFGNNGGLRFRKAINPKIVKGIRFVDYINYGSNNLEVSLEDLDSLHKLKELKYISKIKTEKINVN